MNHYWTKDNVQLISFMWCVRIFASRFGCVSHFICLHCLVTLNCSWRWTVQLATICCILIHPFC